MNGEEERFLYLLAAHVHERAKSLDEFEEHIRGKYETELKKAGLWDLRLQSITVYVPGGLQLNFVSRSVMFHEVVGREYDSLPPKEFQVPQI